MILITFALIMNEYIDIINPNRKKNDGDLKEDKGYILVDI